MEKTIHSEAHAAFCRILRETREYKEITQTALARKLGSPQSFIAKVEIGERRLDVVELLAYAKGLQISPGKLIARLEAEIAGMKPKLAKKRSPKSK